MKTAEFRVSSFEFRAGRPLARPDARHLSPGTRHEVDAFTLIELLTVISIIGLLAVLLAPVLKNFGKPDVTVSATRQMLDDFSRARALAISRRSTVLVVFIPTNFWATWGGAPIVNNGTPWNQLPSSIKASMVVTQAFGAQMNGYMLVSLRDVGDQPGRGVAKDLLSIKTLPAGAFFAPYKFSSPNLGLLAYPTNRPDLPIYGFLRTNNIPFPTARVLTNDGPPNPNYVGTFESLGGLTLPYIAFNYLGQLTPGDGTVLPYDENVPLDYGTIAPALSPGSKLPTQAVPSYLEEPAGNSTNISYNLIHIDRLTGRARLERQDAL